MKKIANKLGYTLVLLLCLQACELTEVSNPNITDDSYINTPGATSSWRQGLQRQLALTLNQVIVGTELVSDNYFNNRTLSSKVFDIPQIDYFDLDVDNMQRAVHRLREMADYGLQTVISADTASTDADKADMLFYKAYAHILAGELFIGLPVIAKGEVLSPAEHFNLAVSALKEAASLQMEANEVAAYQLLMARAYYGLGDKESASQQALLVKAHPLLLKQVRYDGVNGVSNEMQNYSFSATNNEFAPLPRLDFLDPKYYHIGTVSQEQKPISIIKAEEAYLILTEAAIASDDLASAKAELLTLLEVIAKRPIVSIDGSRQTRNGGNRTDYPLVEVGVRFDAETPVQAGYVLDRQKGNITVHSISGTKVTSAEIGEATTVDQLLYLLYRMRQEIFFAEGRRMTDLGIRFPISQTEQLNNNYVTEQHTRARIPSFIPVDRGMDDFTYDTQNGVVTMKYDMNKVLVDNQSAPEIFPFLN